MFNSNVLEVRLVADQTDLHGGTAVRELNWAEQQKQTDPFCNKRTLGVRL